jgi:hypothetical protein
METTSTSPLRDCLGRHRDEVLAEAYQGILGREPDPDGLATHGTTLTETGRLAPVLDAMVQSEEAWRRLLGRRAEALVGAVFRALLDREPEDEARAAYADSLARTGDLEALIHAVGRSAEHEALMLARQGIGAGERGAPAEASSPDHAVVVRAVFEGLLGRAPDEEALAVYTRLLTHTGDVAGFIAEVDRSAEHRRRMLLNRS